MAFRTQKISQMTPKGADLEATDLLEVSTLESGSYVTRSITGQEIIDAASGSGVTAVTGTAPIASSGGTTPAISIATANTSTAGALSSTDWNTFNGKQAALVSGTNIKTIEGQSLLGSGDINLTATDVGLGNVDNTSDLNKPVSTATQTALNLKQNTLTLTTTGTSGAATLVGATLNIPQYSGGGASGIHALIPLESGEQTTSNVLLASLSSSPMIANRLWTYPFFPLNTVVSSNLYINVGTLMVGANCRILIYSDLNGKPNSKLYESANLDCSTLGIKTATTSFTFTAGTKYWLTLHSSSTPSLSTIPVTSLMPLRIFNNTLSASSYIQTVTFGSAPATWGAANPTNTLVPFIGITQV